MVCIWLWMKHFEAWVHVTFHDGSAPLCLVLRFLQVLIQQCLTWVMHLLTPSHPLSSYIFKAGFQRVHDWGEKTAQGLVIRLCYVLKCRGNVVEMSVKSIFEVTVVVFTKCTWLNVCKLSHKGPSIWLTEIDVTVREDCEECCRNWNGSKRRKQVLFFDVHPSRRTPCQILDYTVARYTSESQVHLGMC